MKKSKAEEFKPKAEMPNAIREYFAKTEGSKEALHSGILFSATEGDIDLKTELTDQEIVLIDKIKMNELFLELCGIDNFLHKYLNNYMRLKVSRERKSRGEFVDVNRGENSEKVLSLASDLKNITSNKK
jgi:hypothetical protein